MIIKDLQDVVYAMLLGETDLIISNIESLIKEILADDALEKVNKIINKLYDRNAQFNVLSSS